MPKFLYAFVLGLCRAGGADAYSPPAGAQVPALQGAWSLIEQACVTARDRVVIGPGFPGSREEWILQFQANSYLFNAVYIGVNSDNCRISFQGEFHAELNPNGNLSAILYFPDRGSVKRGGSFEPPCRVLSADQAQKFDARFESVKGKTGPGSLRLRLLGADTERRCEGRLDKMELLFESI